MLSVRWIVFWVISAAAWLETFYHYLDYASRGREGQFSLVALEQLTGTYGLYLVMPLAFWALRRNHWLSYLAGLFVATLLHTTWNWGSRSALSPLLGLGPYDYGVMPVRYLMEFPIDVIGFGLTVAIRAQYLAWMQSRNVERDLAKAKMELLTRQLQPHFLFNALNTVSALMFEDVKRADRVLGRLSEFLRTTIELRDRETIFVREEFALLASYVAVMEARFEEQLSVTLEYSQEAAECRVPPLLLQPLVENAIEHGRDAGTGMMMVDVRAGRTGGVLRIEVEDGGPGMQGAAKGFGLEAVEERLSGAYGGKAGLWIVPGKEAGTVVRIEVPGC